ncbi:MAG: DUF1592 domain-containing protein [Planctomycetaceae bacterium]|nr:DUF1592 domain-containing protein [Planctomycetaceae bacterium]
MPSLLPLPRTRVVLALILIPAFGILPPLARGSADSESDSTNQNTEPVSLQRARELGRAQSAYRKRGRAELMHSDAEAPPQADLTAFAERVKPVLHRACLDCHGPDAQEGNVRIDTLSGNLLTGEDVTWWLEVQSVLSKGEMPPADADGITSEERTMIVDWLAGELQKASLVRRRQHPETSYRRLTRYEYKYALQDLLGQPFDFAKDLPPDPRSEDGFRNSSEMLHMTAVQLQTYRRIAREALDRVTVRGTQPQPVYWSVSMDEAAAPAWKSQQQELDKLRAEQKDNPELETLLEKRQQTFRQSHGPAHYRNLKTSQTSRIEWRYHGAKYAWTPSETPPEPPQPATSMAVLPPGKRMIFEVGNRIPERGGLRVRVLASQNSKPDRFPELELRFGWQASNDSNASIPVGDGNRIITGTDSEPQIYEWLVPLSEIYPRNLVRTTGVMGGLPSPSEYVRFVNASLSGEIHIHHVEVTAPVYEQWPPSSHVHLLTAGPGTETERARQIIARLMKRAWRREVSDDEIARKLALFSDIRPDSSDFEQAVLETLSTVLSSPHFLYVNQTPPASPQGSRAQTELAARLSLFLWLSVPDAELSDLARRGELTGAVLDQQIDRLLSDSRSLRFSRHFVQQWLGLQLLDYLNVDKKAYPRFRPELKQAMRQETVESFHHMLRHNANVLDFVHSDYTFANEKLAAHYGLLNVAGSRMRRVDLPPELQRGGLLTHGGLLAMNSDGKDSHPLKRGIWVLESLLNDPPPPPPPAVPVIDIADPEIAKMTLKERIENHRQQPACLSCHQRIDPWGIAFENFDAVGRWRTAVNGQPVHASSQLFNQQTLDGITGLKRYLLLNRQDQFVRALTHKMLTFALGRPLTFADRRHVDRIAAQVRQQDDGLATLVRTIIRSDVFQ